MNIHVRWGQRQRYKNNDLARRKRNHFWLLEVDDQDHHGASKTCAADNARDGDCPESVLFT